MLEKKRGSSAPAWSLGAKGGRCLWRGVPLVRPTRSAAMRCRPENVVFGRAPGSLVNDKGLDVG